MTNSLQTAIFQPSKPSIQAISSLAKTRSVLSVVADYSKEEDVMQPGFHRIYVHWPLGLAIMLMLVGCEVAQPPASPQSNGIHLHGESLRMSLTTPELMCKAILVMDVGISGLGPGHWNTPDGTRPAAADAQTLVRGGYMIYTPIHFSFMHTHVDYRSQPTKEFDTVGGSAGPDTDEEDYPQVTSQQNYLLTLVYGIDAQAQGETKSVMIVNDAFPIDAQGIVTLQPAHTEQGQGNQVENFPAVTMPLSQITQQLANCKLS
jgi:hypothetical protein